MKRLLNVGQPPAASGSYLFDISATDQTAASATGGSDFASFLVGQGTVPAPNRMIPQLHQGSLRGRSEPILRGIRRGHLSPDQGSQHYSWPPLGYLRRQDGTPQSPRVLQPGCDKHSERCFLYRAEVYVNSGNRSPFTANLKDFAPRLALSWQPVNHLVVRGGGGFYYGPSPHMVGGVGLDSDGFFRRHAVERHLFQCRWQHSHQRHKCLRNSSARRS